MKPLIRHHGHVLEPDREETCPPSGRPDLNLGRRDDSSTSRFSAQYLRLGTQRFVVCPHAIGYATLMPYVIGIELGSTEIRAAVCSWSEGRWTDPAVVPLGARATAVAAAVFIAASELQQYKLVVWHVAVERIDDPIAVTPDIPQLTIAFKT